MPKFTRSDIRKILGEAHTEEIENQIMALHLGVVDSLKDDISKYKTDAEKLPSVQAELDKLKDPTKDGGDAAKIQKAFDDYKAEVAAKEAKAAKEAVLRELAKDAGLSEAGIAKAVKYAEWDKIELDKDGKAKDAKDLIKSLKEEWPEYIQTSGAKGADVSNPPASKGKPDVMKREDIYKKDERGRFVLDAAQRQAELAKLIAAEQQKG